MSTKRLSRKPVAQQNLIGKTKDFNMSNNNDNSNNARSKKPNQHRRRTPKHSKGASKEFKLILPLATDSIKMFLEGHTSNLNKFLAAAISECNNKKYEPACADSLRLVVNPANHPSAPNKTVFQKVPRVRPTADPTKLFTTLVPGVVPTAEQRQAFADAGRPVTNNNAPTSSTSSGGGVGTRGKGLTSASASSGAASSTPSFNTDLYDIVEDAISGTMIMIPKTFFAEIKMTEDQIVARQLKSPELDAYKRELQGKQEEFDEVDAKILKQQKATATFMWNMLSQPSQQAIASKMGHSSTDLAKAALEFEPFLQHTLELHHPEYHGLSGSAVSFHDEVYEHMQSVINQSAVNQKDSESVSDYKTRALALWRTVELAHNISASAPATASKFVKPTIETFIVTCIKGASPKNPQVYRKCQAYLGKDSVLTLARPDTLDKLFLELEKAEALDASKTSKRAQKAAKEQLTSEVTSVISNLATAAGGDITSMFAQSQKKRGPKKQRTDGKEHPKRDDKKDQEKQDKPKPRSAPPDNKDAIRMLINPSKLKDDEKVFMLKELMKSNPDLVKAAASGGDSQRAPKRKREGEGRQRGQQPHVKFQSMHAQAQGGDDDEDDDDELEQDSESDDDDGEDEFSDSDTTILSNFLLSYTASPVYQLLTEYNVVPASDAYIAMLGLADESTPSTKRALRYSKRRFDAVAKFRNMKLSVSVKGVSCRDSGTSMHIIRDHELLVPGSVREISKRARVKVSGAFPGSHIPKYFAQHKLLGLCIYDPKSRANLISEAQAWASGWQFQFDNENCTTTMSHPKLDDKYVFEIGRENVPVAVDCVAFHEWNPTFTVKTPSLLSNFISRKAIKTPFPDSLSREETTIDNEEIDSISTATMTDHHGRQRFGVKTTSTVA